MRDPEQPPEGKGPEHRVETEPPKGVAEGDSGQVSQEIGGTVNQKAAGSNAALSAKGEERLRGKAHGVQAKEGPHLLCGPHLRR